MLNTTKRYKRNHCFIDINTGENVYLYRCKTDELFCVSTDRTFSDPSCMYDANFSDLKELHQKRSSVIKTKPISNEQKQNKVIRNTFFEDVAKDMPLNCENCGKPLYAFTLWSRRCVSAHFLPKAKFKSIAENKDNILFMGVDLIAGVCDCHTKWDYSVENRVKMSIYKLALERYELLKQFLTEAEIVKADKYLGL